MPPQLYVCSIYFKFRHLVYVLLLYSVGTSVANPDCSDRGGACQCRDINLGRCVGGSDPTCCQDDGYPTCSDCGCGMADQYCGGDAGNPTCCSLDEKCVDPSQQECVKKTTNLFSRHNTITADKSQTSRSCTNLANNTNYQGHDITGAGIPVTSLQSCCDLCNSARYPNCLYFTFNAEAECGSKQKGCCHLKTSKAGARHSSVAARGVLGGRLREIAHC